MLQVQACEVAFQTGSEVQHPLLDRVRQCSTAPDRAASFFLQLFHPVPLERFRAVDHAWCARAVASMRDEHDCAAFALAVAEARLKKSNSFRQRAARFLCCGGASPTSKADSHVGHERSPANIIKSSKWWKVPQPAKHRHQRSRDVAACTDASVHSQNGPVQADSCQMPALTAFQGITFGESRQASQQVTEELPQAMADPVQIATADGFDTTSLALPKQAAYVRSVSVTASASSAHEPQVQSLQQQCGVSRDFACKDDEGELVKQHCSAGMEDEQVVDVHHCLSSCRNRWWMQTQTGDLALSSAAIAHRAVHSSTGLEGFSMFCLAILIILTRSSMQSRCVFNCMYTV